MSRKLFLDSRYASVDYSGTYNFTFPTPLEISCLKLLYCQISNTHYNIMSGNQYLDIIVNINGTFTPYSYQLTPGNYSSTQLVTMLNTLMGVSNLGFNWVYNTNQYKLTLICNYQFSLRFSTGPNVKNSCNNVLGFSSVDTSYSASQTSTYIPDLLSPTYAMFWVKDAACDVFTNTEVNDSSYSFIIPFDSQKGTIQSWYEKTTFEQKIYMKKKQYKEINIDIYVSMNNNVMQFSSKYVPDYNFTLLFEILDS